MRGTETIGVRERIGEHEAAFGVGVDDLDGFSIHRGDDIAWARGGAAGHIFRHHEQAGNTHPRLQTADGSDGAEHRGRAAHIVFHFFHRVGGLERQAAGVEGNAFANQK